MPTATRSLDPRALPLVERAVAIFREHGATEVYVYGSVVSGHWDPEWSDIDFAVRGIPPASWWRAGGKVMCELGRDVDVTDLDGGDRFSQMLERRGKLTRVG